MIVIYEHVCSYHESLEIDPLDTNNWRVILGEHVQYREEGTEQKHSLDKIVTHPKYSRGWLLLY
ncbi:hypothetical protein DPMN_102523 [Dreissena polymorpha]|uniref:Uncharacterized protein n=1 Tax=Dreissena polymorpha TaxID=45954 RepID=A0A9D4LJ68_DREPO|nr:hypothetical protein DPMN_127125 [Dreissena polymorpha]KAH3859702.1 hypothetical protein DPMN_102523 [Dreissena polymorpha]